MGSMLLVCCFSYSFEIVFLFSLNVFFSFPKLIPQLFMLFLSNSTEIPLPSSPSKQLTHTISEPKDTSKWLHNLCTRYTRVHLVLFYCKFSISLLSASYSKCSIALQTCTRAQMYICIAKLSAIQPKIPILNFI